MTTSHNSSPEFYSAAEAAAAHADATLGTDWDVLSQEPETRAFVAEQDVETVSAQDYADLDTVLAWEEYHI